MAYKCRQGACQGRAGGLRRLLYIDCPAFKINVICRAAGQNKGQETGSGQEFQSHDIRTSFQALIISRCGGNKAEKKTARRSGPFSGR